MSPKNQEDLYILRDKKRFQESRLIRIHSARCIIITINRPPGEVAKTPGKLESKRGYGNNFRTYKRSEAFPLIVFSSQKMDVSSIGIHKVPRGSTPRLCQPLLG